MQKRARLVFLHCAAASAMLTGSAQAVAKTLPSKVNHLIGQASPYLLSYDQDPVNWYPWGDEAFARAGRENKAVFLSSGFAACHWCHVMHRESFQDVEIADYLNKHFISVIIDREERPDLDATYSRALELSGARVGWPMSIMLTPDRRPFLAGTYFPKKASADQPAFIDILRAAEDKWTNHHAEVEATGQAIFKQLRQESVKPEFQPAQPTAGVLRQAGDNLLNRVDFERGGLLAERKFPLPSVLRFCLLMAGSDQTEVGGKRQAYKKFVLNTLSHMDSGGIQDQLRGGFFRYATSSDWGSPHFEKMLSDNAMIAQCYFDAYLLSRDAHWKQVGQRTLDFCLSELLSPGKDDTEAFFSSIDADSGGIEGQFYKFDRRQLKLALGDVDAQFFADSYGLAASGENVLQRSGTIGGAMTRSGKVALADSEQSIRLDRLKQKLLRSALLKSRPRPIVEKRIIAGWNGLIISALVQGYQATGEKKYLQGALKCGHYLRANIFSKDIRKLPAETFLNLDDYAYCERAFLDLAVQNNDPEWLKAAEKIDKIVLKHFVSPTVGFYFTPNDRLDNPIRAACATDEGRPSACAVAVENLLRLATDQADNSSRRALAGRILKIYAGIAPVEPAQYAEMLVAMKKFVDQRK